MRTPERSTVLTLSGAATLVAGIALLPAVATAGEDARAHGAAVVEGPFATDRLEEAFLDHDGNGLPSLGDELVYTNSSTGPFGAATDTGECVFHLVDLAADSATLHCTTTTWGARGSLTVQGVARTGVTSPVLHEPATWAVTGGTGELASASGEVYVERFEGAGLDFRTYGRLRVVLDG
ncbi:hypothetical protein [Geodermatophilus amargosae]|uniref:hypothetical protein n=1 Tax=Geodermatophilus amargosae TaxID=1296565 RepID=UPI0034DF3306